MIAELKCCRTFREEDGHQEAEGDAGDGEHEEEKEEQSSIGFFQDGQRSSTVPTGLFN
jgi:hypothetical protein